MNNEDEKFVLPEDIPVIYVDTFRIGYDAYRFVFDLGSEVPGSRETNYRIRAIIAPNNAKEFVETLAQSMKKYEDNFGQVKRLG